MSIAFTIPIEDLRQEQWRKQRKDRGFDDTECWSLNHTISQFALPRLIVFRDQTVGFPSTLNSIEEWKEILTKIIEGFQGHDDWRKIKEFDEACNLFAEYFKWLWW